jgi:hypothetical protein
MIKSVLGLPGCNPQGSALPADRIARRAPGLNIARITHRRKPLRDHSVIQWDKRRPMPSYAENFCAALAAYMREALPAGLASASRASAPNDEKDQHENGLHGWAERTRTRKRHFR